MIGSSNVLLVKHLPEELTSNEKSELLKCFGAQEVRVMPTCGQFKHSAFATFLDHNEARNALNRLHQLEVLDCILSVEFARNKPNINPDNSTPTDNNNEKKKGEKKTTVGSKPNFESCKFCKRFPPISPHFGIEYFSNPGLKYKYPEPNADILLNICNALLTVPKFYTQVLHLMNKMNLYPPFSNVAIIPPVLLDYFSQLIPEVESVGSSESEIDSYEKDKASIFYDKLPPTKVTNSLRRKFTKFSPKRKLKVFEKTSKSIKKLKRKRRVFKKTKFKPGEKSILLNMPKALYKEGELKVKTQITEPEKSLPNEKLDSKISTDTLNEKPSLSNDYTNQSNEVKQTEVQENGEASGFGKIQPIISGKPDENIQAERNDDYLLTFDFITEKQLRKGQISPREMRSNSLFDKYSAGEPSCRLYIKNLAKKVTEKDLQFIFGAFVNFEDEIEKNMFNIRLMTKGRMKGQAFISLPNIEVAKKALKLTNGYNLIGKPMVVLFGRSAKVKE